MAIPLNDSSMMIWANASHQRPDDWIAVTRNVCEKGLVLPFICFGLFGNLFTFIVLCRYPQKTTTQVLLQGIVVTDWLSLFSTLLLRTLRQVVPGYSQTAFFLHGFRWLYPCVYIFRFAAAWLTVLLTRDRFIAVQYPLAAQRLCTLYRTYLLMCVMLACTLIFSLPRFFEMHVIDSSVGLQIRSTDLLTHRGYTLGYRIVAYLLFMYLIPMLFMIVLNTGLLSSLRRANRRRQHLVQTPLDGSADRHSVLSRLSKVQRSSQRSQQNTSTTTIVITIVFICAICNCTAMVAHFLWSVETSFLEFQNLKNLRRVISTLSNMLVTLNCAINFVIYCLCSRNFRRISLETFLRMHKCMVSERPPTFSSTRPLSNTLPMRLMSYDGDVVHSGLASDQKEN
ncbi:hypothetical protein CAPTEDRAFT_210200 [Capitella teleta]|uniref:G-protein coupled receptors family 1 profile domain-containing protein n=1 Tax=Capitella teleta TaxID=283909 RepID=R7TVA9_CAPTE|nr:hypothetical protein CAPTEDRAFT_210200 [Capitella teleta]|eukprot:ELT97798.1 hypothetical protein CAPTEDRAFT_210200 [Capitella teleta]